MIEKSIYVAGKYSNLDEVHHAQNLLKNTGFLISYDWTINASKNTKSMIIDSTKDLDGVLEAEYSVILLTDPTYEYRGTFFELGASLTRDIQRGVKKTLVILNPNSHASTCCFAHHPNILYFENIESVIKYLK
jgi:hypothetical protein